MTSTCLWYYIYVQGGSSFYVVHWFHECKNQWRKLGIIWDNNLVICFQIYLLVSVISLRFTKRYNIGYQSVLKLELYVDHRSEGVSTQAVEKKKPSLR